MPKPPARILQYARLRHETHLRRKGIEFARQHGLDKQNPGVFAEAQARLKASEAEIRKMSKALSPDDRYSAILEAQKKYRKTPWGRKVLDVSRAKYEKTPRGRERKAESMKSVAGKARLKRYRQSEKGRKVTRTATSRYSKTPKGIAQRQRFLSSEKGIRVKKMQKIRLRLYFILTGRNIPTRKSLRYILANLIGEANTNRVMPHTEFFDNNALMRVFKTMNESKLLHQKKLDEPGRLFIKSKLSAAAKADIPLAEFYHLLSSVL
ncbi:MAG: hypothetical protein AABW72_01390 [archaeon]